MLEADEADLRRRIADRLEEVAKPHRMVQDRVMRALGSRRTFSGSGGSGKERPKDARSSMWKDLMREEARAGQAGPSPADMRAAMDIIRLMSAGSRIAELSSLEDLEGLAAHLAIPWTRKDRRPVGKGAKRAAIEDLAWEACSLEHALVWSVCRSDPTLAAIAGDVAAGRSDLGGTMRRALRLYATFLRSNLLARGIEHDRVIRFARTRSRPRDPILPAGMSMRDVKESDWIERKPSHEVMADAVNPIVRVERKEHAAGVPGACSDVLVAPPREPST